MNILREWFFANRQLVLFVYGQVFFILGFSILLRVRQRSRLSLARNLPWLAGFGILHGFNEWGDLFIPIQTKFLSPFIISLLISFQSVLLAASFACLFQFGVELLRPLPKRRQWVRLLPFLVFMAWLIGPFWLGLGLSENIPNWNAWVNALARYLLCIPGGLLAAYGLLRQAQAQIRPLGLASIERMLQIAAGALAAYAFLGGVIVPPLPIFPASVINTDSFIAALGFPPSVFRSLAGLVLAVAIIRALEVFDVEMDRFILRMEEEQMISLERERMARDLHDGALQQVYAAGLLAQSLQKQAQGPLAAGLERLVLTINQSIEQLRSFLIQGQAEIRSIELIPALEGILEETRRVLPVSTHWETPRPPILTPEQISHLTAFTREVLSNAIRHAQTDSVEVRLECVDELLRLSIRDFGIGLSPNDESGFGLRNMRDRARLLGAELRVESLPAKGTTILLEMPLKKEEV